VNTDTTKVDWRPFVLAVLLPIVGLIYGIVWLAQNKIGPGLALMGASVLAWVFWIMVVASFTPTH
jgi:hypothetical protein